jgi:hypothetical protein
MINRAAAQKDVQKGAAMVRSQLPGQVGTFMTSYPSTRSRLLRVRLKTSAGVEVRDLTLYALDRWHILFPAFAADVASSRLTWSAVERFGTKESTFNKQTNVRLRRLYGQLSPDQRKAVEKAIRETYGSQGSSP